MFKMCKWTAFILHLFFSCWHLKFLLNAFQIFHWQGIINYLSIPYSKFVSLSKHFGDYHIMENCEVQYLVQELKWMACVSTPFFSTRKNNTFKNWYRPIACQISVGLAKSMTSLTKIFQPLLGSLYAHFPFYCKVCNFSFGTKSLVQFNFLCSSKLSWALCLLIINGLHCVFYFKINT